ncbi:unnamed protein product [Penicillium nalgiovense]|nr:unnamed protein product [Penicillium nalgiovense]
MCPVNRNSALDAEGPLSPFRIAVPQAKLVELETLLKIAKFAPHTYESSQTDRRYGVGTDWLITMRDLWLRTYSWRVTEDRRSIASLILLRMRMYPLCRSIFTAEGCCSYSIDSLFLGILAHLTKFKDEYTLETLLYHSVVPSLPGYVFSSGPPLDRDFGTDDVAVILDQLTEHIGFESGCVA